VPQRESVREITFSLWGATEQLKAEEAIAAEFEKQHPGIRVRLMPMGARYLEKLQAMFVGQAAPDVIMIEISMYDNWASRGVLADLTEDLREITRDHPLLPVPQRAFERNGRFFGLPINCHGHVAYVNLDAFRATGVPLPDETWTWEKLLAQSPQLSRRHGNSSALTDYALLIPQFPIFLTAEGATLFDSDSLPTRVTADQPAVHRAFDLIRRLQASGCVVPPAVQSDQGDFQLFRDGRLAVYFAGRWIVPELLGKTSFAWDVFSVPAGTAGSVTVHGGTVLSVWSKSRYPEEARAFVRFYASRDGARRSIIAGRYAPVFADLAFRPDFLSLVPPRNIRKFSETMEEGMARLPYYGPGMGQVGDIVLARAEQAPLHSEVNQRRKISGATAACQQTSPRLRPSSVHSTD
jgi:multiple sugar transport system substrate-binding protein